MNDENEKPAKKQTIRDQFSAMGMFKATQPAKPAADLQEILMGLPPTRAEAIEPGHKE